MVTTLWPPSVPIVSWQERTAWPSRWTVQAPQKPPPQPNLVPVRPASSRRYQSKGMSGSPSNVRRAPLSVKVTMGPSSVPATLDLSRSERKRVNGEAHHGERDHGDRLRDGQDE